MKVRNKKQIRTFTHTHWILHIHEHTQITRAHTRFYSEENHESSNL